MSQPASAAPSRKKTVISLLVLAALTGIIVLLFKDNWAEDVYKRQAEQPCCL